MRPDDNIRRQQAALEKALAASKLLAEQAALVDALVEHPAWTKFLAPMLQADIDGFEKGIWSLEPERFVAARAAAARSHQILTSVLQRVGQRDNYLKAAEETADKLEKARRILDNSGG